MTSWLPQASYPCGNFSVTYGFVLWTLDWDQRIVRPCFHSLDQYWRSRAQPDFCPYAPREISVLTESGL